MLVQTLSVLISLEKCFHSEDSVGPGLGLEDVVGIVDFAHPRFVYLSIAGTFVSNNEVTPWNAVSA